MRRSAILPLLLVLCSLLASAATKPNIILITLDSTRADRMGFLGAKVKLTPNLDNMARQSMVLERAYAQSPLTVVSDATILSGTYPQSHQATPLGRPLSTSIPYLPSLLRERGYRTGAFVGSIELDPREGPALGFDRGFDKYSAPFHLSRNRGSRLRSPQRRADQVIAAASAWLTEKEQHRFFLWVHLNDSQFPYKGAVSAPAPRTSAYNRTISYTDGQIGKLLDFLRVHKAYDDALIIVTASQGESLGAHGEETHGIFLYDETIHVPLLIKFPGNESAGKRVRGRVRLVDVAPTVLEIAGLPVPPQMEGQSLLRVAKSNIEEPVYAGSWYPRLAFGWSELESWRAGKYLFVRAPRPELYDLNADPGATRNLAQTSKATLATLTAQLDAFDRHFSAGGASSSELTSAEMQKLSSLGYVGLQKSTVAANSSATGADPKDVIVTANKVADAIAAIDNGEPELAVATLRALVAAQPKMYLPEYELGVANVNLQKYSEAVAHLRNAIELQPKSPWAHYEMGLSLLQSGDFKSAVTYLEIAVAHLPESVQACTSLAEAYEHLGRREDASRERSKAAQLARESEHPQ